MSPQDPNTGLRRWSVFVAEETVQGERCRANDSDGSQLKVGASLTKTDRLIKAAELGRVPKPGAEDITPRKALPFPVTGERGFGANPLGFVTQRIEQHGARRAQVDASISRKSGHVRGET